MPLHLLPPSPRRALFVSVSAVSAGVAVALAAGCGHPRPSSAPIPPPAPGAALTAEQAALYVGDAACAPCHPSIARSCANTAHTETLARVTPRQFGRLFHEHVALKDDVAGCTYGVGVHDGRCVMTTGAADVPAEIAVGSGRNGITFLGRYMPDQWAVLRLSYYASEKHWAYSPNERPHDNGWDLPAGKDMHQGDIAACLSCHVTVLRRASVGLDLDASQFGVGCERCHGPGRAHVETARAAAAGRPVHIVGVDAISPRDPARVLSVCGPCHRAGLVPNGDVAKVQDLERFAATGLEASRCYRASRALSCVTCHDPHADLKRNRMAEEAVCLRCHGGAGAAKRATFGPAQSGSAGTACPVSPRTGCIGCHMPARPIPDMPSYPFHNHWIRVWNRRPPVRAA